MMEFINAHPLYIPFLIGNGLIIYEIYSIVRKNNNDKNDDDQNNDGEGGIPIEDDPILDLPPGVTLPVSPKEPVFAD